MILSKLVGVNLGYVGYVRYLNNVNPCFQRGRFLRHRSHERLCRRRSPIGWRMWYGPASLPPNIHPMPRFRGYMQTRLCPIMSHPFQASMKACGSCMAKRRHMCWSWWNASGSPAMPVAQSHQPSPVLRRSFVDCFFNIYIYDFMIILCDLIDLLFMKFYDVAVSGAKFFESHEVPTEAENLERVRQQHPGIGRGLRIHPPEPRQCRKCGKWTPSPQGGAP